MVLAEVFLVPGLEVRELTDDSAPVRPVSSASSRISPASSDSPELHPAGRDLHLVLRVLLHLDREQLRRPSRSRVTYATTRRRISSWTKAPRSPHSSRPAVARPSGTGRARRGPAARPRRLPVIPLRRARSSTGAAWTKWLSSITPTSRTTSTSSPVSSSTSRRSCLLHRLTGVDPAARQDPPVVRLVGEVEQEQLVDAGLGALAGDVDDDGRPRSHSSSAMRSATASVEMWVFARGTVGITDASQTYTPSMPITFPSGSTTRPIPQVPTGWKKPWSSAST